MAKHALALAFILCAASFAIDLHQDRVALGQDRFGELHREWLLTGWERHVVDSNHDDLSLFDDVDLPRTVRHAEDDAGTVRSGGVAAGLGCSHSPMAFVSEIRPEQDDPMYVVSRTSILWRCGPEGWTRFGAHDTVRPVDAAVYRQAN